MYTKENKRRTFLFRSLKFPPAFSSMQGMSKRKGRAPLCIIVGTRPEIIKMAPIVRECKRTYVPYFIIHTGQHYDTVLDDIFFKDLRLARPKYNLHVGSGDQVHVVAQMIEGIADILKKEKPSAVLVEGDTNSVLAAALAARMCNVPLAHVEAGLRSYDKSMPEEINRIVVDHIADILFAPTATSKNNLVREGIPARMIRVVGNTVADAVKLYTPSEAAQQKTLRMFGVERKGYYLLTLHRPGNVDDGERLELILAAVASNVKVGVPILFPLHPRTKKNLHELGVSLPSAIRSIPPLGYFEMLALIRNAKAVLTDSGGLQEEACILHTPCITIRPNTERPETLEVGSNVLAFSSRDIARALKDIPSKKGWKQPFGKGTSGRDIVDIITSLWMS